MSPLPLLELQFDDRFVRELPGDPDTSNRRRQVSGALYSSVHPTSVAAPKLVAGSRECAELIGLDAAEFGSEDFARVFGGNAIAPGMKPFAMNYGGHQFGHWAGQLGDGRAINLGEVIAPDGIPWALQLKGAGPTPYSRSADGLAVLRSSVREFLCSEAMYHLGVPTTRALSLVTTGEQVMRDMFYDGNAKLEPGAVVCRVARSFVRFGSFELPASRGDESLIRALADHVIRGAYPELDAPPEGSEIPSEIYLKWFEEIRDRSARMVAHWQRVGFVHGVMNTDNMSILGETIDYGPYGWLEDYDPDWTPNTTDAQSRRYVFGNQATIVHWNLSRLASTLVPLIGDVEPLQAAIDAYPAIHDAAWYGMAAEKLGLDALQGEDDIALAGELFRVLQLAETDMTIFFRGLAEIDPADVQSAEDAGRAIAAVEPAYYLPEQTPGHAREALAAWLMTWSARARHDGTDPGERRQRMDRANPKYVLRNYLAQVAIDAAEKGDPSEIQALLEVLRRPYDDQPGREAYAEKRPEWARHRPGCSTLSCSS